MVARLLATLVFIGCPVFLSSLNAAQLSPDSKLRYYDSFDPAMSPWQPPQERNISSDYPVRKIRLQQVLDDFFFDQDYRFLVGADREQNTGQVVDLDHGKQVAVLPLSGMPHLGSGITWPLEGRSVFATPNLKDARVTVIDMDNWKIIKEIETEGPGFFMRSHENTPYAWTDVFFGPNRDVMHVIDKRSLEIVKTLRPEQGMTSAHVEFTRDGRHALVSLWDMQGALVIHEAATPAEVKRIPMRRPSGKYCVYNKINHSAGTGH